MRLPLCLRKPACKDGHAFTVENTHIYLAPDGFTRRRCRECMRVDSRRRYAATNAAARARGTW
jgi:hypothetical protein